MILDLQSLIQQTTEGTIKALTSSPDISPDAFDNIYKSSKENPEYNKYIVQIGEQQYRLENVDIEEDFQQSATEEKSTTRYDSDESSSQEESASQNENESNNQPFQALYVLHPLQHTITQKTENPILQKFLQETIQVIKTIDANRSFASYQFQFKEPPLKVTFVTEEGKMQVHINGDSELDDAIQDLQKNQNELRVALQKLFPDLSLDVQFNEDIDEQGRPNQENNSSNKDQQNKDDDNQANDTTSIEVV